MKDFRKLANTYNHKPATIGISKPTAFKLRCNPFVYPFSLYGIINMSIIFLLLIVAHFSFYVLSQVYPHLYLFRGMRMIGLASIGYFFMYLSECMFDSGKGGTKAPDTMPGSNGLEELLEELTWGILPVVVCFLPAICISTINEQTVSVLLLVLLIAGAILFPIFTIRSLMLRTVAAFNPFAAIWNIIQFLPDYLILLLAMVILCLPAYAISTFIIGRVLGYSVMLFWLIYGCVVFWHLMGRFYFKHRALLDWE